MIDEPTGERSDNLACELKRWISVDRTVGLPIGTRVRKLGGNRVGTVMYHQPEFAHGSFPVRFDDNQVWEVLDRAYVVPIAGSGQATVTALPRPAAADPKAGSARQKRNAVS